VANIKLYLLVLGLTTLSMNSCKATNTSRLQTLDNVGVNSPVFEACSGNGQTHRLANLDTEPHLLRALAAVPMSVQKGFFEDLGGRIRVTQSQECGNTSSRSDDIIGCWKRLPDQRNSVEIVIQRTNHTKEQYALVRTFGFVYGDILLTRVIPKNISESVKISSGGSPSLKEFKNHLASTFLGELFARTNKSNIKELITTLESFRIPDAVTKEKEFASRWRKFSNLPQSTQEAFSSRIFAEAFHSQYCTSESLERACELFPDTMVSFEPYAQDMAAANDKQVRKCSSRNSVKASATHREWLALNKNSLDQRRARGADTGSYVNSRIAGAVLKRTEHMNVSENSGAKFNLDGDFLSQIMGLLSGGLSDGGGGGGFSGILSQLLGGLGGGGGGGGLGGLLGNLGLDDSLDNGDNDLGGDDLGPFTPGGNDVTPAPNGNDTPLPAGGNTTAEEQAAIDATNQYRQSQGKPALQVDQRMVADCRIQAQLQAQQGGLTHWLHPAGVARAENIAYGSNSGKYTVMEQWVKSPGHHANIMGGHSFIGVGNSGNQWCQRFR